MLTGRSEGFVVGRPDIDETVRRLRAYSEAGADCLYAPRIETIDHVETIAAAVAPKPANLLINAPVITVAEAAARGVRRISVGGTLARAAWAGFLQAAREIADAGTFSCLSGYPTSMPCSVANSSGDESVTDRSTFDTAGGRPRNVARFRYRQPNAFAAGIPGYAKVLGRAES